MIINMHIDELSQQNELRRLAFPITEKCIYLGHAGVCPLPLQAIDQIQEFLRRSNIHSQDNEWVWEAMVKARHIASKLIGASDDEIALLGPTSLGLNLVANGLPWKKGDEIIYYQDDYPANVYPWKTLSHRGVVPMGLNPEQPGAITWDLIEEKITSRTRLVALASCHFLSGTRIDLELIGKNLQNRNILFSVDGIQSLGAFPIDIKYIDFLSADSHKWLLGPVGAGIFYVKKDKQELLKPTLLGSWNVHSPEFVAQEEIKFEEGARRYEPGTLNMLGIVGMSAAMKMLMDIGIQAIGNRILELRNSILDRVIPLGYQCYGLNPNNASGIISLSHPKKDIETLFNKLAQNQIITSLRQNRQGNKFIRLSPHFYNTSEELDTLIKLL